MKLGIISFTVDISIDGDLLASKNYSVISETLFAQFFRILKTLI